MDLTGKIHIVQRGDDPVTSRDLKEMTGSRAFNVFARRLDKMIEEQRSVCESAESFEKLKEAQGALRSLRRVRDLPNILLSELKPAAWREEKSN